MATYRTDDGTRWGTGKGSPLVPAEVDLNFWELWQALAALEDGGADPAEISNITVVGSQLTFHLDDGRTFGPFTLPTAMLRWAGDWAPATAYGELDLVRDAAFGTYLVLRPHTSAATFDPAATDASSNPLYRQLLPSGEAAHVPPIKVSTKTADYWLELADAGTFVLMDASTGGEAGFIIPNDTRTGFPVGTIVTVQQIGTDECTIWEEAGVTLAAAEYPPVLRKQYSTAALVKIGPNLWSVSGDLKPGA